LRWLKTLKSSLTDLHQGLAVQPTVARLLVSLPELIHNLEPTLGDVFSVGHQLAGRPNGLADEEATHQSRFEKGQVPDALREQAQQLLVMYCKVEDSWQHNII
jgi:ATP-dependent DNA helicase DinG